MSETPRIEKIALFLVSAGRVAINLLDVAALLAVGYLATSAASGYFSRLPSWVPFSQEISGPVQQGIFVSIGIVVILLMIGKSVVSVILIRFQLLLLSRAYTRVALANISQLLTTSEVDSADLSGTGSQRLIFGIVSKFVVRRLAIVTLVADGVLIVTLSGIAISYDPALSAIVLSFVLSVVGAYAVISSWGFGKASIRLKASQKKLIDDLSALSKLRPTVMGRGYLSDGLRHYFKKSSQEFAQSFVRQEALLMIPRYFIEVVMVLTGALVVGGVLFFSNIADNADFLGVMLLTIFRVAGATIPVQNAIQKIVQSQKLSEGSISYHENKERPPASVETIHLTPVDTEHVDGSREIILQPGQTLAIVGPSGVGKSTLLFSMAASLNIGSLNLRVNESQSLQDLSNEWIFDYSPQEPGLVRGSISENLDLGYESLGLEQMAKRLEVYGLRLDPNSTSFGLSGGEIQRISVCRVLSSPAPVALLDEPTSALDERRRYLVQQEILLSKKIVIFATHDLIFAGQADWVLSMTESSIEITKRPTTWPNA